MSISLDAGIYYINFGHYGFYDGGYDSRWYDFWLKEQGAEDPEPLPQPALVEVTNPDPPTVPPVTDPPTVPPVTDPTKTTTTVPNPINTTGGSSTNSNTNSNSNTTPGKVATGDTKSVIGLFSGLLATAGIIFASRKKRSNK